MSHIDDLIQELCPDGAIFVNLASIAVIKTGSAVSKQVIGRNPGVYPVINSGRDPLGYIDHFNTNNDPLGITSRGAGVGSVTWCEGRYFRGNLNYAVTVKDPNQIDVRFLYHLLLHYQPNIQSLCSFQGIPALNKANLAKLRIPIPPLEVQREIVRILDQFTALEAELEAELEARRRQYEHYRQRELTFDGSVPRAALSELARVKTGSPVSKQTIQRNPGPYPVINSGREPLGFIGEFNTERDPLGVTSRGAGVGSITWCDGPYFRGNLNYGVTIKDPSRVNVRFLYHLLQHLQPQIHALCSFQGIPALNKANLDKLIVPLPSFSSQVKIVDLLDKFDALVNDLSIGLPAELSARRKQYEYYRDKLLTFKERA
jgi:type I restriction enzyme S subunit